MKRKLVSILLAAVMTVSSLNITEAASIDAEDFVSSEETVIEHEQDTETEQEIQTETEQQTETNVTSGNDTGFNGEDLTDTPSDITSDPPIETIPHTVTYKADKADLFFNDDLKKLKDGTLEEPFSLSDEAETSGHRGQDDRRWNFGITAFFLGAVIFFKSGFLINSAVLLVTSVVSMAASFNSIFQ